MVQCDGFLATSTPSWSSLDLYNTSEAKLSGIDISNMWKLTEVKALEGFHINLSLGGSPCLDSMLFLCYKWAQVLDVIILTPICLWYIKEVVLFMLSSTSDYIVGHNIVADGDILWLAKLEAESA